MFCFRSAVLFGNVGFARRQRTMRLYGIEIRLECQLAAFNYANALHTLKAEYRK